MMMRYPGLDHLPAAEGAVAEAPPHDMPTPGTDALALVPGDLARRHLLLPLSLA